VIQLRLTKRLNFCHLTMILEYQPLHQIKITFTVLFIKIANLSKMLSGANIDIVSPYPNHSQSHTSTCFRAMGVGIGMRDE
jgi:hypothetical protein